MSLQWFTSVLRSNVSVFLFLILIYFLGFHVERTAFLPLFTGFSLVFGILFFWIYKARGQSIHFIWITAIAARLIVYFAMPALSDDYFRFIWDGLLSNSGVNPFAHLPSEIVETTNFKDIYLGLNSPDYYSVYPPVMQWIFQLSSALSTSVYQNVLWLKVFVFLGEIGVIYFLINVLKHLKLPLNNVLIYSANPLVILETVGNLHFEGLMLCFTLAAFHLLIRYRHSYSLLSLAGLLFALGVLVKLVSLMLLPLLLRVLGWKKSLFITLVVMSVTILGFSMFVDQVVMLNFSQSLDLYFRKFEFNASIYTIVNLIYEQIVGWQEIKYVGPALSLVTAVTIVLVSIFGRKLDWQGYFRLALLLMSLHLFLSTTVHPWYVINLLALSVFTRLKYPLLWSFLVVLSYIFYLRADLAPWMVSLEYGLLLIYLFFDSKVGELEVDRQRELPVVN